MQALVDLLSSPLAQRIGWALIHFLWQGTLVALLLAAVMQFLRHRSAQVRWLLACVALGLMAVMPVVTACIVSLDTANVAEIELPAEMGTLPDTGTLIAVKTESPDSLLSPEEVSVATGDSTSLEVPAESSSNVTGLVSTTPWLQQAKDFLHPILPWGVLGWLAGVIGISLWHFGGWVLLQKTKSSGTRPVAPAVRDILDRLLQRLRITRPIRLLESARVAVPVVVGWLRPVVLLPASVLSGLTPSQLEAILAHELAHIRRFDCLVKLIQAVVETLLFYHPAVWWVSGRIRRESEHCCDELAIEICPDRKGYAHALARIAELSSRKPHLAAAASGGKLMPRIRRIVGLIDGHPGSSARWLAGILVMASLIIAGLIIYANSATGQTKTQPATQPANKEDEAPWGEVANGLQCRLLPPAQTVEPSDGHLGADVGVYLTYQLRNVGEKPVKFLPRGTPLQFPHPDVLTVPLRDAMFQVVGPEGKKTEYRGFHSDPGPPKPKDFITIDPGQTISDDRRIALPYDFSKVGQYKVLTSHVIIQRHLTSFYYGRDEKKARQNPDNVWTGTLISNTAAVKVVPPKGPWGRTVSGQAVRLRPDKYTWNLDQPPILRADIRNRGLVAWWLANSQKQFYLQVDGVKYVYAGRETSSFRARPGDKLEDILIELNRHWLRSEDPEPIKLSPGKHTIQAWFIAEPVDGSDRSIAKPSEVFSNPVEIEIQPAIKQARQRHFVLLVVGKDSMTFQGQQTTWAQLPGLLAKVPNRLQTVLAVATASDEMTIAQKNQAESRVWTLARKYGFQCASSVGIHPLGSKGDPPQSIYQAELEFDKEIPVPLEAGTADRPSLVKCKWIKFTKEQADLKAALHLNLLSGPKGTWRVQVILYDSKNKNLGYATANLENSGQIAGTAYLSEEDLQFSLGKWPDLSTAVKFEVNIQQVFEPGDKATPPTEKWGEPVEGVQVRLRADKQVWRRGANPTFKVGVENNGTKTWASADLQQDYELEIDGKWYTWTGPRVIDRQQGRIKPGVTYSVAIQADGKRYRLKQAPHNSLKLLPGSYTVRVAVVVESFTFGRGPADSIRLVSNPVEIEIQPATEPVSRVAEEKIKYLQIDGKKVEVNWQLRVIQRGFYQSTWFLQRGEEAKEEHIATNVAALSEVDDIKASPNGKYLAVRSVAEGARCLEVIDLPLLLTEMKFNVLRAPPDPFPGGIAIDHWDGDKLIVSSGALLTHTGKDGRVLSLSPALALMSPQSYALSIESGRIEPLSAGAKNPIEYFTRKLSDAYAGERDNAAMALKALNATSAIGALRKALEVESNPAVRTVIQTVIDTLDKMAKESGEGGAIQPGTQPGGRAEPDSSNMTKWGPVYVRNADAKLLWPNYKEQIIRALGIKESKIAPLGISHRNWKLIHTEEIKGGTKLTFTDVEGGKRDIWKTHNGHIYKEIITKEGQVISNIEALS